MNIILSILSIIPPWPGNNSLKSLTSKDLFTTLAAKSPNCPITLKIAIIIAILKIGIVVAAYKLRNTVSKLPAITAP